jgi:hypothetical protein
MPRTHPPYVQRQEIQHMSRVAAHLEHPTIAIRDQAHEYLHPRVAGRTIFLSLSRGDGARRANYGRRSSLHGMVSYLRLCSGRAGELHEGPTRGHAAVVQVVAKRSRRMGRWVLESGRLDLTATAIVGDPTIRLRWVSNRWPVKPLIAPAKSKSKRPESASPLGTSSVTVFKVATLPLASPDEASQFRKFVGHGIRIVIRHRGRSLSEGGDIDIFALHLSGRQKHFLARCI